ncbi:MAG: hypothetical protein CMO55_18410 [Verrucomicrobiales bacterium]|nr:hypothetical protein [Verrucomicrobiales bacterium]
MNVFLLSLIVSVSLALSAGSGWETLQFDGVQENQVRFTGSQITVSVNDSASPIIYPFSNTRTVTEILVSGSVSGELKAGTWDDSLLRVGVIETGTRKLTPLERISAPDWVKQLSSRMSGGVERIHCFLLMPEKERIGEIRTNPDMKLFRETITSAPNADGSFTMQIELSHPVESPGLWILSDGDDTSSQFTISINQIELKSSKR